MVDWVGGYCARLQQFTRIAANAARARELRFVSKVFRSARCAAAAAAADLVLHSQQLHCECATE